MIWVDEKLYEEEYVNVYDEDTNRELNKKNKKKFCLKKDAFRSFRNEKSNYINMYGYCNMYSMFVWIW